MHLVRFGMVALVGAVCILVFTVNLLAAEGGAAPGITYPHAKADDQVDDYHGTKVADPYRWLEDTDSSDTRAWVEAENKVTFGYLEQISYRKAIHDRLTQLWNFERYRVPQKQGGRYFYEHNNGLQNQNVLYVAESLNAEPRVLLDPNTLSSDGTVALVGHAVSRTGSCWPTARRRPAPTGWNGMCARWTPARI